MAHFVLDATVAVGAVIASQSSDDSDRVLAAFTRGEVALVPALWHLETTNAVLVRERRKTISAEELATALTMLSLQRIETDTRSADRDVIATDASSRHPLPAHRLRCRVSRTRAAPRLAHRHARRRDHSSGAPPRRGAVLTRAR